MKFTALNNIQTFKIPSNKKYKINIGSGTHSPGYHSNSHGEHYEIYFTVFCTCENIIIIHTQTKTIYIQRIDLQHSRQLVDADYDICNTFSIYNDIDGIIQKHNINNYYDMYLFVEKKNSINGLLYFPCEYLYNFEPKENIYFMNADEVYFITTHLKLPDISVGDFIKDCIVYVSRNIQEYEEYHKMVNNGYSDKFKMNSERIFIQDGEISLLFILDNNLLVVVSLITFAKESCSIYINELLKRLIDLDITNLRNNCKNYEDILKEFPSIFYNNNRKSARDT